MTDRNEANAIKKAKNIAAVLYMIVLSFVVGGSYLHQQHTVVDTVENQTNQQ